MFTIIQAAGWPIWPLLICSVVALALVIERMMSLRPHLVAPEGLLEQALKADAGRNKRERRTKGQMWLELCALGYSASYGRVCAFARD